MKECTGRVAVVTGAASGIGRGMAEAFVAAGMKVVLSDIEAPALEETRRALAAAGGDVHAVRTDVSRQEQVDELAEETLRRYGAVHVLCNNAGIGAMPGDAGGSSWTSSLEDWRWIIGVNLMGVVHGVRSFLPTMIEQDSEAHIVNTASVAGLIPGSTLYGTTKFAVVGLSENLSLELQRGGLKPKVSVLCPGLVDTRILSSQRNRPAQFGPSTPLSSVAQTRLQWFEARLKQGARPRAVGEQVLAAIRDERFYVLTHPEYNARIEARVKDLVSGRNPAPVEATPSAAHATPMQPAARGHIAASIPRELPLEHTLALAAGDGTRIERIVSRGHVSPPGFWYEQDEDEWVLVIAGAARLEIEGEGEVELGEGDWIDLRRRQRHRVSWTDPARDTIWLAVFRR